MNRSKSHFLKISFVLAVFLLVTNACSDNFESSIPYVQVNRSINLINYNDLTVPNNPVYFSGMGFGGIIVMFDGTQYYAFDAACPYEASRNCTMTPDDVVIECPCCGSTYVLFGGGYVAEGPSTEPLLQYQVTLGDNRLYITN